MLAGSGQEVGWVSCLQIGDLKRDEKLSGCRLGFGMDGVPLLD